MKHMSVINLVLGAALAFGTAAGPVFAASDTTVAATPQNQPAKPVTPDVTIEKVMMVKALNAKPVDVASKIIGSPIYTVDKKKVDDVKDIIFDNNHKIVALTVGVGGFLGIDETYVAIPMKDITLAVVKNKLEVMTNLTEADLRAATAKA